MLVACAAIGGIGGCGNKVLDPTQIGRFRPTPAVNVILESLGVAEEPAVAWEAAEEPQPGDIRAVKTDYILQPGDVVRISIFELYVEGAAVPRRLHRHGDGQDLDSRGGHDPGRGTHREPA